MRALVFFLFFLAFTRANAQMSWTTLPAHNESSIKVIYISDEGEYFGLSPFTNNLLYSETNGRIWETLNGQEDWSNHETFFFAEDDSKNLFFSSDRRKTVYHINKLDLEIQEQQIDVSIRLSNIEEFEFLESGNFLIVGNRGISLVDPTFKEIRGIDFWHHTFKILLMDEGPHILVVSNGASSRHYLFNDDLSLFSFQDFSIGSPRDLVTDGEVIFGPTGFTRDRENWTVYEEGRRYSSLHATENDVFLAFDGSRYVYSDDHGLTISNIDELNDTGLNVTNWISGNGAIIAQEQFCEIQATFKSQNVIDWEDASSDVSVGKSYATELGVSDQGVVFISTCSGVDYGYDPRKGVWNSVSNTVFPCIGYDFVINPSGTIITNGCYSLDQGLTWVGSSIFSGFGGLQMVNDRVYSRDYTFYVTNDFGLSWEYFGQQNDRDGSINLQVFTASENILEYVRDSVNFNSQYWQKRDTFGNEQRLDIPENYQVVSMNVGYGNSNIVVYAMDETGQFVIGISENEGDDFQYYPSPLLGSDHTGEVFLDQSDNLIFFDEQRIFLSQNLGRDWEEVTPNFSTGFHKITQVIVGWDGHLYIASYGQPIYKSSNSLSHPKKIHVSVYEDENFNCEYDIGEKLVQNIPVQVGNSRKRSDDKGRVSFVVRQENGEVRLNLNSSTHNTCAPFFNYDFGTRQELHLYVPVNTVGMCADIEIGASTSFLRRCFENKYHIEVNNRGNETANDVVLKIDLDSFFSFTSCTWPLIDQQGQTVFVQLPEVLPGKRMRGILEFNLSCDAHLGQEHYLSLSSEASNQCESKTSATISLECQPNIGSYDPNDKTDFAGGILNKEIVSENEQLEYRIRFENTGTDTAFNIRIEDPISSMFDLTSIRPIIASHEYSWSVVDGSLIIDFEDIMLPDTGTNREKAQGFIKFTADISREVTPGSEITNVASIYFDFNDPIVTNRTKNYYLCKDTFISLRDTICVGDTLYGYAHSGFHQEFWSTKYGCDSTRYLDLTVLDSTHYRCWITSTNEEMNVHFDLFPNPTRNLIHLRFEDDKAREIYIFGVDGLAAYSVHLGERNLEVNTSDLVPGLYVVLVKEGGVPDQKKTFIKQ